MDMEMPLMDGMTALQHLMIHRPTPTIMSSSLTGEGTARAFDTLKNGAVDFFSKDFIFQQHNPESYKKIVAGKVLGAARMKIHAVEPVLGMNSKTVEAPARPGRVIFCEECGARNVQAADAGSGPTSARCWKCGDPLEIEDVGRYSRNTCVTVFGGGSGSFRNLLGIIPKLDENLAGSLVAVLHAPESYVDAFSEYLDAMSSIKVMRARDGMNIDGGTCYLAAAKDSFCLRSASARCVLQRMENRDKGIGSIDLAMASAAAAFKKRAAGVLLSGSQLDGIRGIATLQKREGTALLADPNTCLWSRLVRETMDKCRIASCLDESELVERIHKMHQEAVNGTFTV